MNTTAQREMEVAELAALITKDTTLTPYAAAQSAVALKHMANRLHRYAEAACNYGLTEQQEKRVASLEKRVAKLCQDMGLTVKFNGDPRGYAVKVQLPSGRYNTWGGAEDGWGI